MNYDIDGPLPLGIVLPIRFRERGGEFEGQISHPREIVERFEPIDVLGGQMELVDSEGHLIIIHGSKQMIEKNEYLTNYEGVYFTVD